MTGGEPKKSARRPSLAAEIFVGVATTGLVAGVAAWVFGAHDVADALWASTTVLGFVAAMVWVVASLRAGRPGVDVLAVLALAGTLLVGEYVAGALVTVMLGTGRVLEQRADGPRRARAPCPPRTYTTGGASLRARSAHDATARRRRTR